MAFGVPVESMHGKTIVVTGASDGIGRAAVRSFAQRHADTSIVMIGRNEAKTAAAARSIMSETGHRLITWDIADLSRQDAVRDLAQRLRDRLPVIDVLVNNAGAMFLERERTAEGLEHTFALNHLQYFTLTLLLLQPLSAAPKTSAPTRVLNVSSRAHMDARFALDDLQMDRGYSGIRAYANSKLCNVLFTCALARRLDPTRVVTHALHPGVVSTRFATNNGSRGRVLRWIMDLVSISPDAGADTITWLATSPEASRSSGDYWVKRARVTPSPDARDASLSEGLWHASATLARLDADALIAASGAAAMSVRA